MIRALVDEQIPMMRAGFSEHAYHPRLGRIDANAHVQRFHREPGLIDADHLSTSRSQIAHSCSAELGHCTLTLSDPRRSSTRIGVLAGAGGRIGTGTKSSAGAGNALGAEPPAASARSASTTQRRSKLALIAGRGPLPPSTPLACDRPLPPQS